MIELWIPIWQLVEQFSYVLVGMYGWHLTDTVKNCIVWVFKIQGTRDNFRNRCVWAEQCLELTWQRMGVESHLIVDLVVLVYVVVVENPFYAEYWEGTKVRFVFVLHVYIVQVVLVGNRDAFFEHFESLTGI